MDDAESVELEAAARDRFLGDGGTGVLSFAAGDDAPHSVPVSYGYDERTTTFYFRLAVDADDGKDAFLDEAVSFVVYGRADDEWHSVVATGRLESTTAPEAGTDALAGLERVRIPVVDIFGRPPREVSFEFYRLVPERLSGRKEARSRL